MLTPSMLGGGEQPGGVKIHVFGKRRFKNEKLWA